jgi:Uma2 family endonuclease
LFLQGLLCNIFFNQRSNWGITCLPEQRIQVHPTRFRISDITILKAGAPRERILTKPPLLVIEIQSPEDTLRSTASKVKEYLAFGIASVWVIDPGARTGYSGTAAGLKPIGDGQLEVPGTSIRVHLNDLFVEMDQA